jgi:hypothetical protein
MTYKTLKAAQDFFANLFKEVDNNTNQSRNTNTPYF